MIDFRGVLTPKDKNRDKHKINFKGQEEITKILALNESKIEARLEARNSQIEKVYLSNKKNPIESSFSSYKKNPFRESRLSALPQISYNRPSVEVEPSARLPKGKTPFHAKSFSIANNRYKTTKFSMEDRYRQIQE